MNYSKNFPLLVISGIIMTGCSNDMPLELEENSELQKTDRISELIEHFYDKVHPETRSSLRNFVITDIDTKTFSVPDSLKRETRSGSTSDAYDIHTVSVDFGETTGYVILSDTPEIDEVFYYTEAGCINDTALIAPLREMVENTPKLAENIITGNIDLPENSTRATEINIQPLVRFEWDQNPPFNNYATYCTCSECSRRGNHMPIGCVTIAVGQTIATLEKFNGTFYGNRDIDFNDFPNRGYLFTPTQSLKVAHFLQEVALTCQIKFGCDGSSGYLLAAAHCLLDNGYKCDVKKGNLDIPRYIMNLQEGLPHLLRGTSDEGGHMWILDGLITNNGTNSFHINWGWGYYKSSGWASEKYYVANSGLDFGKSMQHLYLGGVASK